MYCSTRAMKSLEAFGGYLAMKTQTLLFMGQSNYRQNYWHSKGKAKVKMNSKMPPYDTDSRHTSSNSNLPNGHNGAHDTITATQHPRERISSYWTWWIIEIECEFSYSWPAILLGVAGLNEVTAFGNFRLLWRPDIHCGGHKTNEDLHSRDLLGYPWVV